MAIPQSDDGRRFAFPQAAAVFLLALALRILLLLQLRDSPIFSFLAIDSAGYDRWAREIAGGDWLGSGVFYQAPLYPYFLGLVYLVFGPSLLAARVVQALLGSAACVLLSLAGRRFFGYRAGLLAGLLMAAYPPALFFDFLIQKSTLDLFLLCLLLLLLAAALDRATALVWTGTGLALGCLMLTRENAVVLVPAALAWLAWRSRSLPRGALLVRTLFFFLALALVLGPVAARNRVAGGHWVLTSFQSGSNFYIGNNPSARGTYMPLIDGREEPHYERQDAVRLAEKALGRSLTPPEVSAYWRRRAFEFMVGQPGAWLRLMGRKMLLVVNAVEVTDTDDQEAYGEWSWLLRWLGLVLHFGVLFPLAAAGMLLCRASWRRTWVLHALLASYGASVALFYVFARYRYPLVPGLMLFAAGGMDQAGRSLRARAQRGVVPALAALALAAIVSNLPLVEAERREKRLTISNNMAATLIREGKSAQAIPLLQKVLAAVPNAPAAKYNLASALNAQGRTQESLSLLARAAEDHPSRADLPVLAGKILLDGGNFEGAARWFERGLAIRPDDEVTENYLGMALAGAGRADQALTHFARAAALAPSSAGARFNYGGALLELGRVTEALPELRAAVALDPSFLPAQAQLAEALRRLGRN